MTGLASSSRRRRFRAETELFSLLEVAQYQPEEGERSEAACEEVAPSIWRHGGNIGTLDVEEDGAAKNPNASSDDPEAEALVSHGGS
jgi:hypothetical protein